MMARKSSRLQAEALNRRDVVAQARRRMALIQRVDIVAPLLQRRQPRVARAIGIRDIVDLPAEAVDLEHRLALLARQNAHRRVERTAGRGCPVTRIGCRRLRRHAPAAGLDTGRRPTARRDHLAGDPAEAVGQAIRARRDAPAR